MSWYLVYKSIHISYFSFSFFAPSCITLCPYKQPTDLRKISRYLSFQTGMLNNVERLMIHNNYSITTRVSNWEYVSLCVRAWVSVYMHECVWVQVSVYESKCVLCESVCVCMYVCVCVCVCVCVWWVGVD